jgi:hypothetical protein
MSYCLLCMSFAIEMIGTEEYAISRVECACHFVVTAPTLDVVAIQFAAYLLEVLCHEAHSWAWEGS